MKVSDYIAAFLKKEGVPSVFEVSGGMIAHLLDSIYRQGAIRVMSMHHEQGAAFAADAVGRITGKPGVALATSGPGATNLITGIGSCYFDSSPAVFITGQVNRRELKGNLKIRQLGFQEADIVSMVKPITKNSWQVREPEEVPRLLRQAFDLAQKGRPGPVLLDIPMDVQRADIASQEIKSENRNPSKDFREDSKISRQILNMCFDQLLKAERPLLLVGGGIRAAKAAGLLSAFARKIQVPVVNSLMAVGTLSTDDPLNAGMIGSYGNRWANLAIDRSDFLLVLGSRLDIRQTGSVVEAFKGDRNIFHVDCETGEINNRIKGCRAIVSELSVFLKAALHLAEGQTFRKRKEWLAEIQKLRQTWPDTEELRSLRGINPNIFMHQLSAASRKAGLYVVDVGQHQMWAAQSLEIAPKQRFLTSGGMGSMGFALPAAIGAAMVTSRPISVIAGDAGFQHNIQELETIVHHQLPIKMVILNNRCHGMVRQFQQSYFERRYPSTLWGYSSPSFERVARAYGIPAETIEKRRDTEKALRWLWRKPLKPSLLEVRIDTYANVYPKIAFGKPMTEMEPLSLPREIEGA